MFVYLDVTLKVSPKVVQHKVRRLLVSHNREDEADKSETFFDSLKIQNV